MYYTPTHFWLRRDRTFLRIGLTDAVQRALGNVVRVDLERCGTRVGLGGGLGWIETEKAVIDLLSPASGRVATVNEELLSNAGLIHRDPYGRGWLCDIELEAASALPAWLDAAAYAALVEDVAR